MVQGLRDKLRKTVLTTVNESIKLLKNEDVSSVSRLQVAVSFLGKLEKFITSDTREPRDAEKIAEDKARIDPFSDIGGQVSEPVKNYFLEKDLAELKQGHNGAT